VKGYEVLLCGEITTYLVGGREVEGLDIREKQVAHLEKVLQGADICPTIDNDGIGPYEFGGARCYDHGTDRLIVEPGEDITVRVLVRGVELGELAATIKGVEDVLGDLDKERTVQVRGAFGKAKAVFVKRGAEVENGNAAITYDVEWEAEEELEADEL
jgi:hypothetical protein